MRNRSGESALVTGGLGFIGSHLATALSNLGVKTIVLDDESSSSTWSKQLPDRVQRVVGDVRSYETVAKTLDKVDTVFHFAAFLGVERASADPMAVVETEVLGAMNIVKGCLNTGHPRKVVYASSSEIYGDLGIVAYREDQAPRPKSIYGLSKLASEKLFLSLSAKERIPVQCLRLFNVYGPGQDSRFVISRFIERLGSGQPPMVHYDGKQTRDFTYIDDCVDAVIAASCLNETFVANIGTGQSCTILSLARLLMAKFNFEGKPVFSVPRQRQPEYEIRHRRASAHRLRQLTGFKPKWGLSQGLDETIRFVQGGPV